MARFAACALIVFGGLNGLNAARDASVPATFDHEDVELLQRSYTVSHETSTVVSDKGEESQIEAGGQFGIANDHFMRDGAEFVIRSGSVHYPRIPREYWRDRLERVRALGLNAITTYVFWNFHEKKEGEVKFDGQRDVQAWLELAHELDLLVILRPGPYVCAEWDMGGLPAWLLQKENISLRTYNEPYIAAVTKFWDTLLPMIKPLLYVNGGPIVLVQLENEFGSYGNVTANPGDAEYMYYLYDLAAKHLGTDVIYSTVDGGEDGEGALRVMSAGSPWKGNSSVLATVDGGVKANYTPVFHAQRRFNAQGNSPKMWSELWVGWFDFWGFWHHTMEEAKVHDGVLAMARTPNASFSLYMAHGGTSGIWSGANMQQLSIGDMEIADVYEPDITSYDYSAPVNEEGRHGQGRDGGDLFVAIQSAISDVYGPPKYPEPAELPLVSHGTIVLDEGAVFMDNLDVLSTCQADVAPGKDFPSFEDLGTNRGLVVYEAKRVWFDRLGLPMFFTYSSLRDFVQVLVDGFQVGTAYRADVPLSNVLATPPGKTMTLIAENMGRVNYGTRMGERKGLLRKPPLPGPWTARCVPLESAQVQNITFKKIPPLLFVPLPVPAFRRGVLRVVGQPQDTLIDSLGLSKGYMWINGEPIGRYWETKGPQHTYYVPAPLLRSGDNEVIVFDFQDLGGIKTLNTTTTPRWTPWNYFGAKNPFADIYTGQLAPV